MIFLLLNDPNLCSECYVVSLQNSPRHQDSYLVEKRLKKKKSLVLSINHFTLDYTNTSWSITVKIVLVCYFVTLVIKLVSLMPKTRWANHTFCSLASFSDSSPPAHSLAFMLVLHSASPNWGTTTITGFFLLQYMYIRQEHRNIGDAEKKLWTDTSVPLVVTFLQTGGITTIAGNKLTMEKNLLQPHFKEITKKP